MTFPAEEQPTPQEHQPVSPEGQAPQSAPAPQEAQTQPAQPAPKEESVPTEKKHKTAPSVPEPDFDFPRIAEDVAAFRRQLDEIEFKPAAVTFPEERPAPRPTAQRRRRRSNPTLLQRPTASQLGERLESVALRSIPTVDFFIFAFLSGCLLAVGYLTDSPAILLLGIVTAPILAPWIGAMMAISTGELRFFGQTIGGFFTSVLMIFIISLLAGFASQLFQPLTCSQAYLHARLWWPDLLLLILGTALLVVSFIQSEEKPILASLMLAYEFFLPASAAGFGLGSGAANLWPQAGLVLFIHMALSLIISLLIFSYMGFRPVESKGYVLLGASIIISLTLVAGFFGLGIILNLHGAPAQNTTPIPFIPTQSPTPNPPTVKPATATPKTAVLPLPTNTPLAAESPTPVTTATSPNVTPNPSAIPTPIYGRIQSVAGGLTIRYEPDGKAITTILNGYLVEFLPVDPVTIKGALWVKVLVRLPTGDIEGWVLRELILTATPFGSP